MKQNLELALIMKKKLYQDGSTELIPIDVVEGSYDEVNEVFIDVKGTPYYHIITNPDSIGYIYRDELANYRKNYPHLNLLALKANILYHAKKNTYIYCLAKENDEVLPAIVYKKNKINEKWKFLLEKDIIEFYENTFPDFLSMLANSNLEEENKDINTSSEESKKAKEIDTNIDIAYLYAEITKYVIDQDEPIRKILTAIWKQYNDFSSFKSRNILINGSTGVGKTETFRQLTKLLKVPYFMTSATDYTAAGYVGKSVEDMLIGLLKNANYDVENAERGILIIDEIDKLSESSKERSQINQRDVQEALLKILEDGTFNLTIENKQYTFNTSRLLVVGMGSWSRIELKETRPGGFESKSTKKEYKDITREDIVAAGMIPELIGRFPVIVQMNELSLESLLRILKSEKNVLNTNKAFLLNKGIDLKVDDEVLKEIAASAIKGNYGARGLDEIIETALSIASFEIASNPNTYSDLIITSETIKNNKSYTLVKRKDNK